LVGAFAAIDDDGPFVVDQRGLRNGWRLCGGGLFGDADAIEEDPGLVRAKTEAKRLFLVVLIDFPLLVFDQIAPVPQQIDGGGPAGESGGLNVRLDRHGGVFKRRLANRDVGHGQVFGRPARPDHDRVDRRHAGKIVELLARVRGAAVGHQENTR
jgi:hypothetical protein